MQYKLKEDTLEYQLAHCDGKDCTCMAYGECECACDADWTPAEVYLLRDQVDALRKDAERGRLLIDRGEWFRFDHDTPDAHALLAVRLPYDADLSCKPAREDALDAAIAAEGEK